MAQRQITLPFRRALRIPAVLLAGAVCARAFGPVHVEAIPSPSGRASGNAALLRTESIPARPIALAVYAMAKRIFVLSQGPDDSDYTDQPGQPAGHASVSILDAASGRLLHITSLGPSSYVGDSYDYSYNFPPLNTPRRQGTQALAVDERAKRVFVLQTGRVASSNGSVRVLDAVTGRIIQTVGVGQGATAMAADTRSGRLFVLADTVRMLSTTTGALLRTIPIRSGVGMIVDARHGRALIFALTGVFVLDARTGQVLRRLTLAGSPCFGMALDEQANHLIAGAGEARIVNKASVFDATTGALLHLTTLPQDTAGAAGSCPLPLAADSSAGRAFIAIPPPYTAGSSYVSTLDTRNGHIVRTVATGFGEESSPALAIDHRMGRAYVIDTATQGATVTNELTMLDVRSGKPYGKPRRSAQLGKGPPLVAVDEQTRRLFVINGADNTVSVLDTSRL